MYSQRIIDTCGMALKRLELETCECVVPRTTSQTLDNPTLKCKVPLRVSSTVQNLMNCGSLRCTRHGDMKTPSLPLPIQTSGSSRSPTGWQVGEQTDTRGRVPIRMHDPRSTRGRHGIPAQVQRERQSENRELVQVFVFLPRSYHNIISDLNCSELDSTRRRVTNEGSFRHPGGVK